MSDPLLLTLNPGSSTIKFGLFRVTGQEPVRIGTGKIDFRLNPLALDLSNGGETVRVPLNAPVTEDLHEVIDETLNWFAAHFSLKDFVSVGHRVVHGGDRFAGPVAIDDQAIAAIDALVPLAPLHQPQSLRLIRAIRALRPHLLQSASFDTAFHRSQADVVQRFAIPSRFFDEGIKRYGFHGLSYQFIASQLAQLFPTLAKGKAVVAHLGSGASLCALDAGVSRDSSMGFSTLDGIPMATRCGALDAGVVLHLLEQRGRSLSEVEDILYHQSGLLGVSGLSADSRELLASPLPQAREALDLFAFRIAGEVARLATTLGGLDALVFTAGIGEHQPEIRAAVCERLAWLGIELDAQSNAGNARVISSAASRATVLVLPTDEEQVIAREALSTFRTLHREEHST
ncbi:acetate/propionate family kinase [Trinickia violacea]|uniref:Acetate kinase n=1 Tax=Trinickia violacea TaxID=2571746 RepID=A0A4P8IP96_9BURK|nr:acetate/propionate family kinase [Trinickia violacea]QCP49901.1 acetate/propionate family kinase [Trinickia violacea]